MKKIIQFDGSSGYSNGSPEDAEKETKTTETEKVTETTTETSVSPAPEDATPPTAEPQE